MLRRALSAVWVVASLTVASDRLWAQELPPLRSPGDLSLPRPSPPESAERAGSPVEELERLTGRRGPDEIETDRDSFTPATTTAPRQRLITEAAYSFIDNRRYKETHSFPELLLRYGLADSIELRVGCNYEVGGAGGDVSGVEASSPDVAAGRGLERATSLSYGLKVGLTEQRRWVPRTALIVQGATPVSGRDTKTDFNVALVGGWELPNRWKLDAAFRYGVVNDAQDHSNLWAPSVVLKVPLGEKWGVHAEYFAIVSTGKAKNDTRQYFSPGVHYLVTPDLEVGTRFGWGLNDQAPRFFVNAGLGWRY
jgi:hypothetical protein